MLVEDVIGMRGWVSVAVIIVTAEIAASESVATGALL